MQDFSEIYSEVVYSSVKDYHQEASAYPFRV